MMEPIFLNDEGECITGVKEDQTDGSDVAATFVAAFHVGCKWNMSRFSVSVTHDVLVCARCCLRLLIPGKIKTFGQLRKYVEIKRTQEDMEKFLATL